MFVHRDVADLLEKNGNKTYTSKEALEKYDMMLLLYSFGGMPQADVNEQLLTLIPKLKVGGKLVLVEECARYTG